MGRFFWKLFLINAALMALVLVVCVWLVIGQFDRFHDEELTEHLRALAAVIEASVGDRFDAAHADELNALAREIGSVEQGGTRVTFVLADGSVLGDPDADPATMESHANRPEIQEAIAKGWGSSTRWSHTVSQYLRYVAVRVGSPDAPAGVVRVALAVRSIGSQTQPARRLMASVALLSVAAAIVLALGLAALWSGRIRRITRTAQELSRGNLSAVVRVRGRDEVSVLARSLNRMRERITAHLDTIDRQRSTLDALVSQLREGVVVVDADGRVVLLNPEARRLLQPTTNANQASVVGRPLEQCIRQHDLQEMLQPLDERTSPEHRTARGDDEPKGSGLALEAAREARVQIETESGAVVVLARAFDISLPIVPVPNEGAGPSVVRDRVLLLTDVTELTRAMQMKADLAANASHELRTPLSAIRAAVDTLRTMDWLSDGIAAAHFFDVIDRHSHRMETIVRDLLDLSRLEAPSVHFDTARVQIGELLTELETSVRDTLDTKQLRWETTVADACQHVDANPELLRMALRNLIDNAVRFTDSHGKIGVTVRHQGDSVVIEVQDDGCGIRPEDQGRVFERFYQVQRARSGGDRGTGLGLSIVRHAVAAMKGRVDLESELGRGTRVAVTIPKSACAERHILDPNG